MLTELIRKMDGGGGELTGAEVEAAVEHIIQEAVKVEEKADFLTALAKKGATAREIASFAGELRKKAVVPLVDADTRRRGILDVCGTGGDRANTFNISTTVALVLASGGVTVAKHGNRAITSHSGSADVLEALGVPTSLSPQAAAQSLRDHHFAFFFAPQYHPAFKHIAPARRLCAERGQKTIFNFLGPLLNPVQPSAQIIGVPQPALCELLSQVLPLMGVQRGLIVCGSVGEAWLDELSTLGENVLAECAPGKPVVLERTSFAALAFQQAVLADLGGGDAQANAQIIRRLLLGQETGPRREMVLLNAAAAFWIAGKCARIEDGWPLAVQLIDSGQAHKTLEELIASGSALKTLE